MESARRQVGKNLYYLLIVKASQEFMHPCEPWGGCCLFYIISVQLYNQGQLLILLLKPNGLEIIKTWQSFVNWFNTSPDGKHMTTLHPPSVPPFQKAPWQLTTLLHFLEPHTVEATPLAQGAKHNLNLNQCALTENPLSRRLTHTNHNPPCQLWLAYRSLENRALHPDQGNFQPPSQSDSVWCLI